MGKKYIKSNLGLDSKTKQTLLDMAEEYGISQSEVIRLLLNPKYSYQTLNKLKDGNR